MSLAPRQGSNLQHVKWQNRAAVLQTLWRYQPLSRKDLADRTHLTPATLTNIIADYLATGLLQEIGLGEQTVGRRPMMLSFVPEYGTIVGVNLSRQRLRIALFDLRLRMLQLNDWPIDTRIAGGDAADTLIALLRQVIDESGAGPGAIRAIGISSPGPLSMAEGVIYAPPHFDEWSNLPLGQRVQQAFELPVWLENDSNANALAEQWIGAGQTFNDFIYVENHTGVGSGIILNGRLFTGSAGIASELGHTSIDRHGPRCQCGNYGCVELYSSGTAIVQQTRARHAAGRDTALTATAGPDLTLVSFDHILDAARAGDALAIDVLRDASRAVGLGLVNAINLIDPEAVIIGHKLNKVPDICLPVINDVIQEQTIPQAAARLNVLSSALSEPIDVTGAACRALSGLLQRPELLART